MRWFTDASHQNKHPTIKYFSCQSVIKRVMRGFHLQEKQYASIGHSVGQSQYATAHNGIAQIEDWHAKRGLPLKLREEMKQQLMMRWATKTEQNDKSTATTAVREHQHSQISFSFYLWYAFGWKFTANAAHTYISETWLLSLAVGQELNVLRHCAVRIIKPVGRATVDI